VQVLLDDKDGRGVYGAHVLLQILGLGKDAFLYLTGYKDERGFYLEVPRLEAATSNGDL